MNQGQKEQKQKHLCAEKLGDGSHTQILVGELQSRRVVKGRPQGRLGRGKDGCVCVLGLQIKRIEISSPPGTLGEHLLGCW